MHQRNGAAGVITIGRGNRSSRRKPAPVPIYNPTNPTLTALGLNPIRRGEKPAIGLLIYAIAIYITIIVFFTFFFICLSRDRSIASSKVLERDCPGKVIMW
jgi:hypothetical protein